MQSGALAFLDCLGFKGIWNKHAPEAVIAKLETARDEALSQTAHLPSWFPAVQLQMAFLSDTIVVGVTVSQQGAPNDAVKGLLVSTAGSVAQHIVRTLIRGDPPISVRGCINYGKFLVKGNYIIGDAVDEAAALHEKANGAFVWLLPGVLKSLQAYDTAVQALLSKLPPAECLSNLIKMNIPVLTPGIQGLTGPQQLAMADFLRELLLARGIIREDFISYSVPLKGGDSLRCAVVNPFAWVSSFDTAHFFSQYEQAMSGPAIDVLVKYQNTHHFLRHAAAVAAEGAGRRDKIIEKFVATPIGAEIDATLHLKPARDPFASALLAAATRPL